MGKTIFHLEGRTLLKITSSFADLFFVTSIFFKMIWEMCLHIQHHYLKTSCIDIHQGCPREGLCQICCCLVVEGQHCSVLGYPILHAVHRYVAWSDFDIGTMTAPQVIAGSCGTTKNALICPYLVPFPFWKATVKLFLRETLLYIRECNTASPNCTRLKHVTSEMDSTLRNNRRSSSNGVSGLPFLNAPIA